MMAIWLGLGEPPTQTASWYERLLSRFRRSRREFIAASNQRVLEASERVRALEARFDQYEARRLERYRNEASAAVRALRDV